MSDDGTELTIYSDGGCRPNPGPGGWGAVVLRGDGSSAQLVRELSGSASATTNNRMEITAALEALRFLTASSSVCVVTDSTYLRNGITQWVGAWRRREWKTKSGSDVLNRDLWQALEEQVARHRVQWRWVRGHSGHRWNERADQLATQALSRATSGGSAPATDVPRVPQPPETEATRAPEPIPRAPEEAESDEGLFSPRVLARMRDLHGEVDATATLEPEGPRAIARSRVPRRAEVGPSVNSAPPANAGDARTRPPDPWRVTVTLGVSTKPVEGGVAWAVILQARGQERVLRETAVDETTPRLLLRAALAALRAMKRAASLDIHASGDFLAAGVESLRVWKAQDWRATNGRLVAHADLWRELDAELASHDVLFRRASEIDPALARRARALAARPNR